MSERHGARRRWYSEPGASALPLTTRVLYMYVVTG